MLRSLAQYILNKAGVEAARSGTLRSFIRSRDIDLVVDVGANLGQFAQKVRSVGYLGRILSIEPASHIYDALARAKVTQPWEHHRTALGSVPGEAVLEIPDNHTLASLKPIKSDASKLLGFDTASMRRETVQVTTLDDLLTRESAKRIFLKIDTQGFEREVLEGGTDTLKRTVGVLLELPLEHLYEGVWSLSEALSHMDSLGFMPAQFRTVGTIVGDPASAIEVDCVFRRKGRQTELGD